MWLIIVDVCFNLSMCVLLLSEVSCKTMEGLDGLKKLIYQVVLSMKDSSSSAFGSKLLGRLVSGAVRAELIISMPTSAAVYQS